MTICERIDSILKEKGISRRKLAIKAGISPSSFQTAMQRNTSLSLDMILPIADVLGVSVGYLYSGDDKIGMNNPFWKYTIGSEVWNNGFIETSFDDVYRKQQAYLAERMRQAFNELNEEGQLEACKRVEQMSDTKEYRRIAVDTPLDESSPESSDK